MKKITLHLALLAVILTGLVSPAVFADAESERANLARLVSELEQITQSIAKYRKDASNYRQYSFDYDALTKDIESMRIGVVEYIAKDLSLARDIPPLSAQYVLDNAGAK